MEKASSALEILTSKPSEKRFLGRPMRTWGKKL